MNHNEVTDQILSAFDDEEEEASEPVAEETEVVDTDDGQSEAEEEETPDAEPEEETQEEDAEEDEDESEDDDGVEEELPVPVFDVDDPEIQHYLQKYQGDLTKALKGAAEANRLIGRHGEERRALAAQVQSLQTELERRAALEQGGAYLNAEQQEWVQQAVESDPHGHVRAAVEAGEYDLARAVCEAWSEDAPYEAARLAGQVDQIEQRAIAYQSQPPPEVQVDHAALMSVLINHFPEMPAYEERMVSTLATLGSEHPLAQDARSNDPETAARGIIGIYEIARASSATVKSARENVRATQRQAADEARRNGVVSSGTASPVASGTPRPARITPGLTMDQLDEAFKNA